MKRHLEREKAHREATADMSEELSEGEKGDAVGDISAHDHGDSVRGRMPRVSSVDMMANLASPHADKKLYLVLIRYWINASTLSLYLFHGVLCDGSIFLNICSLHGLIRGENMELGRDSDTGGQVGSNYFNILLTLS